MELPVVDPQIAARLDYRLNLDFPLTPEAKYYRVLSFFEPNDVVLEVGGLCIMPAMVARRWRRGAAKSGSSKTPTTIRRAISNSSCSHPACTNRWARHAARRRHCGPPSAANSRA